MSDQHPNGEDIARMLREQGPVQAPPELADDVMRQVRAETRPTPARRFRLPRLRPVLIPALGLAAAAALVVGIAHLGHTGSSSSAGLAGGAESRAVPQHSPATLGLGRRFVIPSSAARSLSQFGVIVPHPSSTKTAAAGANSGSLSGTPSASDLNGKSQYTLTVHGTEWRSARDRLQTLALAHERNRGERSVVVILKRKP
jgi:hypothetical protein